MSETHSERMKFPVESDEIRKLYFNLSSATKTREFRHITPSLAVKTLQAKLPLPHELSELQKSAQYHDLP